METLNFNVFNFLNKSKKTTVPLVPLCPTFPSKAYTWALLKKFYALLTFIGVRGGGGAAAPRFEKIAGQTLFSGKTQVAEKS